MGRIRQQLLSKRMKKFHGVKDLPAWDQAKHIVDFYYRPAGTLATQTARYITSPCSRSRRISATRASSPPRYRQHPKAMLLANGPACPEPLFFDGRYPGWHVDIVTSPARSKARKTLTVS